MFEHIGFDLLFFELAHIRRIGDDNIILGCEVCCFKNILLQKLHFYTIEHGIARRNFEGFW